ncbi:flagellar motor protein [Methylocaldum sp. MU1018]
MDPLSIIGVTLGLVAVLGGNWLEGGHIASLLNGPAMVIVFGGTLGATLLQTPPAVFLYAVKMLKWVFMTPPIDHQERIKKIVGWSALARREGLLGLETFIGDEREPLAKKGLQLLVDGNEPEAIRDSLEVEIYARRQRELSAAKVYEAMGGYAPTVGIIGAVMGLIHVMQNLSDPGKLGAGIATAFVATIYGVSFANLIVLPIANKLKSRAQANNQARELILEGIISIAEGENPRNIEMKLTGFLDG